MAAAKTVNTFHPFPKLAPELRCKIWKEACQYSRLIELEAALNPGIPSPAISDFSTLHTFIKVSSRCRVVPGILHATTESRVEAQQVYKETNFERQPNNISTIPIYYNKDQDILFFGEDSCFATIISICQLSIDVPRIAISTSIQFQSSPCCPDPFRYPPASTGPGELINFLFKAEDSEIELPSSWNGWGSLREVIFVLGNDQAMFETSAIDTSAALRSVGSDACTELERRWLDILVTQIKNYDEDKFDAAGKNRWLQEPQPKIQYMTRGPAFPGEIVNDHIYLHWRYTGEAPEFVTDSHWFVRETARDSNCTIAVSHKYLSAPSLRTRQYGPLQLSFRGTSSAIRLAKKMFELS